MTMPRIRTTSTSCTAAACGGSRRPSAPPGTNASSPSRRATTRAASSGPSAEVEALRERHQPITTINHVSRKIDLLCGLERKASTDPKAFPRTPTEEDRADAATQVLRYVTDDCDFPIIRSAVYENMLVEGFGGCIIDLEDDGQGGCRHHPALGGLGPPLARSAQPHAGLLAMPATRASSCGWTATSSRRCIPTPRMSVRTASPRIPAPRMTIGQGPYRGRTAPASAAASRNATGSRRANGGRSRIHAQVYWSPPQRSPLKDRKGKAACRLIMQSAYVDRENKRFGIVRDMISPAGRNQQTTQSKALHLLSTRLVISETGAVEDEDKARREVAKPDGFVTVTPGMRFEIAQTADLAAGQMKLLEHATHGDAGVGAERLDDGQRRQGAERARDPRQSGRRRRPERAAGR